MEERGGRSVKLNRREHGPRRAAVTTQGLDQERSNERRVSDPSPVMKDLEQIAKLRTKENELPMRAAMCSYAGFSLCCCRESTGQFQVESWTPSGVKLSMAVIWGRTSLSLDLGDEEFAQPSAEGRLERCSIV